MCIRAVFSHLSLIYKSQMYFGYKFDWGEKRAMPLGGHLMKGFRESKKIGLA